MSDDEPKGPGIDTRPPPPGEEDLYSASTVVGQASAELLALVRAAEEKEEKAEPPEPKLVVKPRPSERPAPTSHEQKLAEMKEAASRSAKEAAANEVAREAKARASAAPPAVAAAPPAPAAPAPAATRHPEADSTAKRPPARTAADEVRPSTGLPPIIPILGLFAAAALVLAALVR